VSRSLSGLGAGEVCSLALRPEAIVIDERRADGNRVNGVVEEVSFLGSVVRIRVRFQQSSVSLDTFNNPGMQLPERGRPVTVSFAKEDLLVLDQPEIH
jgi:putative spermidine/putrescine transport system ATP-binding protein